MSRKRADRVTSSTKIGRQGRLVGPTEMGGGEKGKFYRRGWTNGAGKELARPSPNQ